MMRIIGVVILFFIIFSLGPGLIKQYFRHRIPFGWAMNAGKATGEDAVAANVQCLKNAAKQYGLESQANTACGTKKGTDYISCMKEFFLTEDALAKTGTTDVARGCAGITTQKTIDAAGENLAWAKFCSKIPWYVPGFFKTWIQCPGSH